MRISALYVNQLLSIYMFGFIWLVQLSIYPNFAFINPNDFQAVHQRHSTLMGALVGPIMVGELILSFWLIYGDKSLISISNLLIVLGIWGLTFLVSVPLHNKLSSGFDILTIQKLINTNWFRTILWSLKVALTTYWVFND
jgi:hypothetical protein